MKNLTPELITKAKAAKSAEELFAFAKDNNVELTEAEAKTYFEQLNANGTVSDEELDAVVGGGSCPNNGETYKAGTKVRFTDGTMCPKCRSTFGIVAFNTSKGNYVKCAHCAMLILNSVDESRLEVI